VDTLITNLTPYLYEILGTGIVFMAYYALFNKLNEYLKWWK
jgi:hypothetical protein